jgi:hypothetical protein
MKSIVKEVIPLFSLLCFGVCETDSFTIEQQRPIVFHSALCLAASADIELKSQIQEQVQGTQRGLATSKQEEKDIEQLVKELEVRCPFDEPARNPLMDGRWIVDYTTAPPPSNGKLGPFVGVARQIIDLEAGTYTNYLSVPGEIKKEWLSATLDATFEEWDGSLLKDDRIPEDEESTIDNETPVVSETPSQPQEESIFDKLGLTSIFQSKESKNDDTSIDFGRDSWKVDFKTLSIKVFGFPLYSMKFKEGTSRVWRMSYLDEATRVVRAGRTGNDEDAMLFYMSRDVEG